MRGEKLSKTPKTVHTGVDMNTHAQWKRSRPSRQKKVIMKAKPDRQKEKGTEQQKKLKIGNQRRAPMLN